MNQPINFELLVLISITIFTLHFQFLFISIPIHQRYKVKLEDGSAEEVAVKVCGLYFSIIGRGDLSLCKELFDLKLRHPTARERCAASKIAEMSEDSCDDDEEEEDIGMDEEESHNGNEGMDIVKLQKEGPVVDDDGFQMVSKGNRKHF